MAIKKYWKRIIALIMTILLLFAFSACMNMPSDTGIPDNPPPVTGGETETGDETDDKTGEPEPEPEPEDPKIELYGYTPVISEIMPRISINTDDGSNYFATYPNREIKIRDGINYVGATVSVSYCESKYEIKDAVAEVKARGNYTMNYAKKPFRIKFDKKQSMLGLNNDAKCKSWVLLAEWKDLAALNNATTFYLGKTILESDGYYSSDYRHVELYLNGQYWGVYLLAEQQQINENRVDIAEPAGEYTGNDIGYLMEFDGYYNEENPDKGGDYTFTMNYSYGQKGYTIKSDIYSSGQVSFIKSYMDNAYKIATEAINYQRYYEFNSTYTGLVNAQFADVKSAVSSVIDIQSLVDTYIMHEIACDPDISWSSFYMNVDMSAGGDKKLVFDAPWDFDSAYGIKSGIMNSAVGMFASTSGNPWLALLANQSWFKNMVKEKWAELVKYGVLQKAVDYISEYADTYSPYFAENFTKWPSRISNGDGEVTGELNSFKDKNTAQKKASECLERWLTARLNFLDDVFGSGSSFDDTDVDETIPEGADAYRYEAENAAITGGIQLRTGNGASGNGYLGVVSGGAGKTITFEVIAASATSAYLFIGLSKLVSPAYITSWFSVTVGSVTLTMPNRYVPSISDGEEAWHAWTGIKIMPIDLIGGKNKIVLTTISSSATNVDYIDLYSVVALN